MSMSITKQLIGFQTIKLHKRIVKIYCGKKRIGLVWKKQFDYYELDGSTSQPKLRFLYSKLGEIND